MCKIFALILWGTCASLTIMGTPGDLDSSFGVKGFITTALGSNSTDAVQDVGVQSDGKIVAVGSKVSNSTPHTVIVRYNPDGSIDTSFASQGFLTINMSTTSGDTATSVEIQADGKIVVSGHAHRNTTAADFYVLRLNGNGSLDTGFGSGGRVYTDFDGLNDHAYGMAIQLDGKIVLGGQSDTLISRFNFALARFNTDGSLDPTFGTDGKVSEGTPTFESVIRDLKLQPDGKIIASGRLFTGTDSDAAVLRYNSDGTFDQTFDSDGMVVTSFGAWDFANSVNIHSDGKISVAGTAVSVGGDVFTAFRLNSDGSFDQTFDQDGKLTTSFGTIGDMAFDSVLLSNGKLLVTGMAQVNRFHFALVRYNPDGSLDTEFGGGDGKVTTALGTIEDQAFSLALTQEGKIVVGGSSFDSNSERDFAVTRYHSNGSIDQSFGLPGRVYTSVSNNQDNIYDIETQPDGKILVAGASRGITGGQHLSVVRYDESGALDTSFSGGKVTVQIGSSVDSTIAALALQPDGKIIVGGWGQVNGIFRIVIARLNVNGSIDTSFGSNGRRTLSTGSIAEGYLLEDLALQTDGKIVLGCLGLVNNLFDFVVIRLTSNGSDDTSFDSDGKAIISLTDGNDRIRSIAIQNDGKVVATGGIQQAVFGDERIGVARFLANGSIDTNFGNNGTTVLTIANANIGGEVVALQRDGKILVGGGSGGSFSVARLNENGTPDTSFDQDGLALIGIPSSAVSEVKDLAVQKNGKILLVGLSSLFSEADFTAVRLLRDGSIDGNFANQGIFNPDFGTNGETFNAVAIQSDGKIVAGGGINELSRRTFALFRLIGDPVQALPFDYDGDGRADLSVRRPSDDNWYVLRGTAGYMVMTFGVPGDLMVPADYDGDGKTDIAMFRPSTGQWFIFNSQSQTFVNYSWGADGDLPVPADHDGDGKADLVVFRPLTNTWYTRFANGTFASTVFGVAGDKPVVGDFDGDGKADIALYRPSDNNWYILKTGFGFFVQTWGVAGDIPVPADYDGDGKTDVSVFRPSTGQWFRINSTSGFDTVNWGANGDQPIPADYDGDGKSDVAVFRPSNATWYIVGSTSGQLIQNYGVAGDLPTQSAFIY